MADGGSRRGPGPYALGVDLGTTYTAAALCRGGQVTMVELATRSSVAPSVVLVRPDGSALYGEAADRRAVLEPAHIAREFKRRMGDTVPMLLGGVPHSPESLGARLLAWVVERVTEAEGGPPSALAVTHPANWGPYKLEVFGQLLELAGQPDAQRLTEPEAAAIAYAADERPPPDAHLAVYDLGGGTFDTVVLRRRDDRFALVGRPAGIEHLGGVDFDEALYRWVWERATGPGVGFDLDDEVVRRDLVNLRRECVTAKEALSVDTDVVVPVRVGPVQRDIPVSRDQFADLIRSTLGATTVALGRVIEGAGLTPEGLHGVLLVGGSSRIPLVTELIEAELDRPVVLDVHPKHVVARGAALLAGSDLPAGAGPVRRAVAPRLPTRESADGPASEGVAAGAVSPTVPGPERFVPPSPPAIRLRPILVVVVVVVAGLGLGAWLATGRGDDGGGGAGSTTTSTASSTTLDTNALDARGATAYRDWNFHVLGTQTRINDALAGAGSGGEQVCRDVLTDTEARWGEVTDLQGRRVPTTLAHDVLAISRPELRDAILRAVDVRVQTWQACAEGDFARAADLDGTASDLDLAVAVLISTTTTSP